MLIAKLGESVVSGHEQIVTSNVVVLPERRPMALYGQGQHIPLLLRHGIESTPCLQRTKMNRLRFHLRESPGELRTSLLLPEADAIPMVKRDITNGGPAV
jgi:hypothetical protein